VFSVFETLQLKVFETYKECAINKVSLFLCTNEKSSQLPTYVTYSTEVSSIFTVFSKHADAFAPPWHKFKYSVLIEIGCWQVMRHVHHFTAQTKNPAV
jgi:hypothetical protein